MTTIPDRRPSSAGTLALFALLCAVAAALMELGSPVFDLVLTLYLIKQRGMAMADVGRIFGVLSLVFLLARIVGVAGILMAVVALVRGARDQSSAGRAAAWAALAIILGAMILAPVLRCASGLVNLAR